MKAEFINHMGDDLTIVNSARVSFDKESWWANEEDWLEFDEPLRLGEKDTKLIKYLARHNHWTPFSHCMIQMRETVPIFVARQRFKHMVGFTYNEVSRRYVDDDPELFIPDKWRSRAENKKQGSGELLCPQAHAVCDAHLKYAHEVAVQTYDRLLSEGVCPEQARMVLPQSMYTSYYVTGSLAAWARAYKQRIDSHAQAEIQFLAQQWDEIIRPFFPVGWEALING